MAFLHPRWEKINRFFSSRIVQRPRGWGFGELFGCGVGWVFYLDIPQGYVMQQVMHKP